MKVTLERLPESRVQLNIEVDQDRVDQSMEAAFRRLSTRARVPGFRPGKAPRQLVERHIGRERLMNEALEKLVPDVYNEVIEAEDVDAIDQPHLDKVETDPVRLSFIVPVRPTVDLGEYTGIRVEPGAVEVTDEMVAEQVMLLRRRHAIHAPVDRTAAWDDVLTADVTATVDGETFVEDESAEFGLREGQVLLVPGFAEALVGMAKGDEKSFELPIPDDFRVERFRNKTASFTVTLHEVKEEQLPDEDDELAAQVNADEFPTFEALRDRIRGDLENALREQEDSRLRTSAVDLLVAGATVDFPNVLVEREIDHLIQDQMGTDQRQYAAYLARAGRSESQYRETLREPATARVRRSLALSHLAEAEGVDVSTDDVEAEIEKLAEPMGDDADRFRQMLRTAEGISSIRSRLLTTKTLDRLIEIATNGDGARPATASKSEPATKDADASGDEAGAKKPGRKARAKAAQAEATEEASA